MRVETKILIDNYPEEFPFCDMSTGENTVGTDVCVCDVWVPCYCIDLHQLKVFYAKIDPLPRGCGMLTQPI